MDILQRLINNDPNALKELYEHFSAKVYNTALSYLQDIPDAEEVTQDVFVEIHYSIHKFKNQSSLSTWVYQITVRKSLDLIKYKNRAKRSGNILSIFSSAENFFEIPDFEHPGILLDKKEDVKQLFKAIDQLPEHQKTAIILTYIEELPQKEVAEIMKVKLKAVESLLQRAKSNLKKSLIFFE